MSIKKEIDQFGQVFDNLDGQSNGFNNITTGIRTLELGEPTPSSSSLGDMQAFSANSIMEIKTESTIQGSNGQNFHVMDIIRFTLSQEQKMSFNIYFSDRCPEIDELVRKFNSRMIYGIPHMNVHTVIEIYSFWLQIVKNKPRFRDEFISALVELAVKVSHQSCLQPIYLLNKKQIYLLDSIFKRPSTRALDYVEQVHHFNTLRTRNQPFISPQRWLKFYYLWLELSISIHKSDRRHLEMNLVRSQILQIYYHEDHKLNNN